MAADALARARQAANRELPLVRHRFGYRYVADAEPLAPPEIRKLLAQLDAMGIEVRALQSRKQLVLERRSHEDIPAAELEVVRRGARSIAEFLLRGRRR
jgi:hypothetical protein